MTIVKSLKKKIARFLSLTLNQSVYIINNKKLEINMARPRVIELDGGTVSLQGFTPEKANELVALLKNEKVVEVTTPALLSQVESKVPVEVQSNQVSNYSEIAIGIWNNKERVQFELFEIKFDPKTKMAIVANVSDAGSYKAFAINNFKFAAVKLGLI